MASNPLEPTNTLFWVCPDRHKVPRDRNQTEMTCPSCGKPMEKQLSGERMKRMLAAMIAQQESAEKIGNVDEAKMFAERITQLLTKYDFTEDDLADPKVGVELMDPIFMRLTVSFNRLDWMVRLATCVAEANGARVLFPEDRKNGQMFFLGTKSARKRSFVTFVGLARLALTLSKAELSLYRKSGVAGSEKNSGWRPSFVEAFVDSVVSRLPQVEAPIEAINRFIGDSYGRVDRMVIEREDKVRHAPAAEKGKFHGQAVNVGPQEVQQ